MARGVAEMTTSIEVDKITRGLVKEAENLLRQKWESNRLLVDFLDFVTNGKGFILAKYNISWKRRMKASTKSFLKTFLGLLIFLGFAYEVGFSFAGPNIFWRVMLFLSAFGVSLVGAFTAPWVHEARLKEYWENIDKRIRDLNDLNDPRSPTGEKVEEAQE